MEFFYYYYVQLMAIFFLMEKLLVKIWYENICRVLVVYTILDIEVGLDIEVSRAQES